MCYLFFTTRNYYQGWKRKFLKKWISIQKFRNWMIKFFRNYQSGKSYWKDTIATKRIGTVIYIIKAKLFDHKRHVNQIRSQYIESIQQNDMGLPTEVLYDAFEITPPINQKALVDVPPAPSTSYTPQIPQVSTWLTMVGRKSLREKKAVKQLHPNPN